MHEKYYFDRSSEFQEMHIPQSNNDIAHYEKCENHPNRESSSQYLGDFPSRK